MISAIVIEIIIVGAILCVSYVSYEAGYEQGYHEGKRGA